MLRHIICYVESAQGGKRISRSSHRYQSYPHPIPLHSRGRCGHPPPSQYYQGDLGANQCPWIRTLPNLRSILQNHHHIFTSTIVGSLYRKLYWERNKLYSHQSKTSNEFPRVYRNHYVRVQSSRESSIRHPQKWSP